MNRILFEVEEVGDEGRVVLSDVRARHIRRVLKSRPGDVVRAGIVDGRPGRAELVQVGRQQVELRFQAVGEPLPPSRLDVLLALPRPRILNRLWPQLAALGVGRILLARAKKVERSYFESHVLEPAFYRHRLIDGLQQAGDTRLPRVTVHRRFKRLLEDELDALVGDAQRVVLHPGAGTLLRSFRAAGDRVLLAIGPEGGWTAYELERLGAHGFEAWSLGPRILRTDTACVAAITLARAGCET